MLYATLFANVLAFAIVRASVECSLYTDPNSCLSYSHCGWKVDTPASCGWCTDLATVCSASAPYDCTLRCDTSSIPYWAMDSCSSPDTSYCGDQCQNSAETCQLDATCWALANATYQLEQMYAESFGCLGLPVDEQQACEDNNQVFYLALNQTLREYCWGSANSGNAASCSLYEELTNCYAVNCSNNCQDCGLQCEENLVDCLFDEDCNEAFAWLMSDLQSYGESSSNPFLPYAISADKDAYCSDSSTSQYCDSTFDTLWTCLSDNCLENACAYKNCGNQMQACFDDGDCVAELSTIANKYPAIVDETPGLEVALIQYVCTVDSTLTCTNSNLQSLLKCYGSRCCWDPDVCPDAGLPNCGHPDCLRDACIEVKCLPQAQDCLKDTGGCGNALIRQGQWDYWCTQCVQAGNSEDFCTANNTVGLDCSVLDGTDASMYLQYYCWQSPSSCDSQVADLLQCIGQNCVDCTGNDPNHDFSTTPAVDPWNFCDCVFGTCWSPLEKCFFDENCWKLYFGQEQGYGFDAIFTAISYGINNTHVFPGPTAIDQSITDYYCYNKNCTDLFWNVWYCVFGPLFLGDTYECITGISYWQDQTMGCGVGMALYNSIKAPEIDCLVDQCLGFTDDCLSSSTSGCYETFFNAASNEEYNLCIWNPADPSCVNTTTFSSNYLTRCGSHGADCPETYDNFANCIYEQCLGGTSDLPGAASTANCMTTTSSPKCTGSNCSGASMQSAALALLLSAMLLMSL